MDGNSNVVQMSNDIIDMVYRFNEEALGLGPREIGLLPEKELEYAMKAMKEEAYEFQDAHQSQNLIGAVDAALDQIYFVVGFLKRMGLTKDQVRKCFKAVHECNMQKKLGVQQKRGGEGVADAVKPEGWTGPEEKIAQILGG